MLLSWGARQHKEVKGEVGIGLGMAGTLCLDVSWQRAHLKGVQY